jgi:type I restriction enzyme R subunit
LENISLALGREDFGETFFKMSAATSGNKRIGFKAFSNDTFHVFTELTYTSGKFKM